MQCVWSLITLVSLVFSFSAVYQWIRLTSLFISSPKDPTYFLLNVLKRSFGGRQKNVSSVTRYFARQLLNKHAKNYQNAEKITKFLLSTKMVWKSIKHISKTLSITEAMFSQFFFLTCTVDWICAKCKYGAAMIVPGPGSLARNRLI